MPGVNTLLFLFPLTTDEILSPIKLKKIAFILSSDRFDSMRKVALSD